MVGVSCATGPRPGRKRITSITGKNTRVEPTSTTGCCCVDTVTCWCTTAGGASAEKAATTTSSDPTTTGSCAAHPCPPAAPPCNASPPDATAPVEVAEERPLLRWLRSGRAADASRSHHPHNRRDGGDFETRLRR